MPSDKHDASACEFETCALRPFSLFCSVYDLPGIDIVLARRIIAVE